MTLGEMTGKRHGIIYSPDRKAGVFDWSGWKDGAMPLYIGDYMGIQRKPGIYESAEKSRVDDIVELLWGAKILDVCEYDKDLEIVRLMTRLDGTGADVYTLRDGTIIFCPDTWD